MTVWLGARRFGLAVFVPIYTAFVVARPPALSIAGISCTASDGAWLAVLFAAVVLTSLPVDLVALLRCARGRDAALIDVTIRV